MFVGHAVPVKDVLRAGENRLSVYFHSPIKQTLPQWASNGFDYPADNDHFEQHLSVFTRKAPYSYGWDWGIRMVTCGIWRPVTLQFYDCARVDDFHTRQLSLTDSLAVLSNRLEVRALSERDAEIRVTCALSGREVSRASRNVRLSAGLNVLELPLEIQSPQRWMPNGWGKPVLYDCVVEVVCGGDTVAEQRQRIGLRTFRVVNKEDADGESFYFEVNGIPMFAKGANFIPGDALLPRMDEERYRALFRDVKEANMNVVRVWGGGVYEDDCFYDLADENGVLIWQDFMFACTAYPGDAAFLERVKEEADYNIRRLRNHACLALWCGNNEIAEGLKYWGWQSRYSKEVYEKLVQDYDKLFCRLLPERVAALDSGRFYVHTSPYFANWGRPALGSG